MSQIRKNVKRDFYGVAMSLENTIFRVKSLL